jgi:hypothetical protein
MTVWRHDFYNFPVRCRRKTHQNIKSRSTLVRRSFIPIRAWQRSFIRQWRRKRLRLRDVNGGEEKERENSFTKQFVLSYFSAVYLANITESPFIFFIFVCYFFCE